MGGEEDRQQNQETYNSFYLGQVVDRQDPLGLGRVRVRIPGLFEPPNVSPWALPLGGNGGGTAQRGDFHPPEKDAYVGILFWLGVLENPFYIGAHWGKTEVPTGAIVTADDEGNYVKETKFWSIETDERSPVAVIRVTNKATGDFVEFDGPNRKITTLMDTSKVEIDGGNGRVRIEEVATGDNVEFDGTNRKIKAQVQDAFIDLDGASDKIKIEATALELGKIAGGFPALRALVDDRILALFNAHTHLGNLGAPTSNPMVSIPATVLAAGEGPGGVTTTRTKGN